MIVHGALALLMAVTNVTTAALLPVRDAARPIFWTLMLFHTAIHVAVGVLQVVSGAQLLRRRGRVLAVVALVSAFPVALQLTCLPTSIALAMLGVWVLSRPGSRELFDQSGTPAAAQA